MDSTEKLLLGMVILNLSLSAAHWALEQIAAKTKTTWDDRALVVVDRLLTLLEWLMSARRRR